MNEQTVVSNKRIARNTLFLYVRMFLSMAVSIYTSRVVLLTLGVSDYGIWNVVAGVIGLFSFLNTAMSGATSRFFNMELGKGTVQTLQHTFSAAMTIHIGIAVLVVILGETIGLWFLKEKLIIPPERFQAALFVYQFVIASTMVNITQVPYNAMIMAQERMDAYAYVEILNVLLKLAIVYLLVAIPFDKLPCYGILTFFVNLLIASIYRLYCRRRLSGCHFGICRDMNVLRPMLTFSGWDLYGNMAVVARAQGVNVLLNMFFSTAMNAASGIATQLQGAVRAFAGNVVSAFRPQIIKSYAKGDYERMSELIVKASQYTTLLLLLFTIPLWIELDYVLALWLKQPPSYASVFTTWVLAFNLIANLSSVTMCGVHATGNIKRSSIINGTLYLLVIPFSYIAYKLQGVPQLAYIFNVVAVCCGLAQNLWCLHRYVPVFLLSKYVKEVVLKLFVIGGVTIFLVYRLSQGMESTLGRLFMVVLCSTSIITAATYSCVMSVAERRIVKNKISEIINKWQRQK